MLVLAAVPPWLAAILVAIFLFVCVLLILAVLIQRPAGGGLSGAFGSGAGSGQTAFGAKTGDALTIATIAIFTIYILFAVGLNFATRPPGAGSTAVTASGTQGGTGAAPASGTPAATTGAPARTGPTAPSGPKGGSGSADGVFVPPAAPSGASPASGAAPPAPTTGQTPATGQAPSTGQPTPAPTGSSGSTGSTGASGAPPTTGG